MQPTGTVTLPRAPQIEVTVSAGNWPAERDLKAMAANAIGALIDVTHSDRLQNGEISIVFTNDAAIADLNHEWREKQGATNVLSFPQNGGNSGPLAEIEHDGDRQDDLLGDVVLASETVAREAKLANKPIQHHIVHLIMHGVLHLIGYDHQTSEDAEQMESVERRALELLNLPDPYIV